MLRLKVSRLLYSFLRCATQGNDGRNRMGLVWFWYVHSKLSGLVRKPNSPLNSLIALPVLYRIGFFRKSADDVDPKKKMIQMADIAYDEVKYDLAENILQDLFRANPGDDEILWRLARIKYEFSKDASKDGKSKLLEQAQELLKNAIGINGQNGYAHKWLAILLDTLSSTKGIRERIDLALQVREHLLEALKYIPNDGTTHHILGLWYYTIADFTWYERKIASTLNSKFPYTTHEEALELFKRAEEVEPDFYSKNYLYLGKCYIKLNDNSKAVDFLIKARDYPQKTQEDKDTHQEALKLLQNLGVK